MEIRHLPGDVTALMHSSIRIASPTKCILELVLNSLDAQATSIAVRVDSQKHRIQVVDNGMGMTKEMLETVGENYMTSKYALRMESTCYASLGEALANIRTVSSAVVISSRSHHSSDTHMKVFETGRFAQLTKGDHRPAQGTTVTVYGFLDILPLRQACWKNIYDMVAIRSQVEALALANTQVSFSVRDDTERTMIIRTHKTNNPLKLLESLRGKQMSDTVRHLHGDTTFGFEFYGYAGVNCIRSNVTQYVFLNRRPVRCIEIQDLIIKTFVKAFHDGASSQGLRKTVFREEDVLFLFYVECPAEKYILTIEDCDASVEFHDWQEVSSCIKNAMNIVFVKEGTPCHGKNPDRNDCESERYRMSHSRGLGGRTVERVNDAKISSFGDDSRLVEDSKNPNLLKTPENMQPALREESSFFLRKHRSKRVSSYDSPSGIQTVVYLPLNREGLCRNNIKLKKKIFNNVYKKSHGKVVNFNQKMFEANIEWRKKKFKMNERSVPYSENYKTANENERSMQLRKYVRKFRKTFEKNVTLRKCATKMKAKRPVVVKKGSEASKGVFVRSCSNGNLHPFENRVTETRLENNAPQKCSQDRKKKQIESSLENNDSPNVLNASSHILDPERQTLEYGHLDANDMEWSDWSYHDSIPKPCSNVLPQKEIIQGPQYFLKLENFWGHESGQRFNNFRKYSFLPAQLSSLLNDGNIKLTKRVTFVDQMATDVPINNVLDKQDHNMDTAHRRQDYEVRLCVAGRPLQEITLGKKSLEFMEVVRQINDEFIVALTKQDGKHLMVLIDQHAIDERIRYEWLLRDHAMDEKKTFITVNLDSPIHINDFTPQYSRLLLTMPKILERFGVRLRPGTHNSLFVTGVPKCFVNQRHFGSEGTLACAVRKLLQEIAESLTCTRGVPPVVPAVIRHAISTEACHGAIKFGDPLSLEQCRQLVTSLKNTAAPGRCAHGRPSMIPLLDLSGLEKRSGNIKRKLKFRCLRRG